MLRKFKSGIDFIKKVFLVVGVFYIIFVIFGNIIVKNRPQIDDKAILAAQQKEIYKILDDKELNSTKTGKITLVIYRFTYCSLIGELCTNKPVSNDNNFKASLFGKISSLIALPYQHPPASSTYWVTNTLQKAGFIPKSYAAEGTGFASIKPLMNLWTIFRDVAYLIIVLVLVFIGFMIMFRMKLNPQTVISVENSLPKIVVALLLITFSFAIAGLLIDIMNLLIIFSISILSSGGTSYDAAKMQNEFLGAGPGTLWNYVLPPRNGLTGPFAQIFFLGDALATIIPTEINNFMRVVSGGTAVILFGNHLVQAVKGTGVTEFLNGLSILGNGVGFVPQLLIGMPVTVTVYALLTAIAVQGVGVILGLIVFITIFALWCRIIFMLFRSYLQILISIVFAPIILLLEAVPGKSTFSYWLKGLIGELITFPVVIIMLLVGKVMMTPPAGLSHPGNYWYAPFIGNFDSVGFGVILGAGLIFIIPDMVKFVKESLGVKPMPFNIGVGTFLGGAGIAVGGGMSILQQFSTLNLGLAALGGGAGSIREKFGPKPKARPSASDQGETTSKA